jgi:hypothetical protein
MNPFELARMRHVDLLALLYLTKPEINELLIAPYRKDEPRPVCSKEQLVTHIMKEER